MPPAEAASLKIPCTTPQQLQNEIDTLARVLEPEEKEETWEKFEKAINRFAGVTRGGGYKHQDVYIRGVGNKGVGCRVADCMLSDRGRLSGVAIELLQTMAPRLGMHFQPLVLLYLPPLVRLLARPNKIYIKRAEKCLLTIISHCPIPSILVHLRSGLDDRADSCKRSCATSIEATIHEWERSRWHERDLELLELCVRKMATDRDAEVRKTAKRVWGLFVETWPERVEGFTNPLTPTIRRYLDISADGVPTKPKSRPALRPAIGKAREGPIGTPLKPRSVLQEEPSRLRDAAPSAHDGHRVASGSRTADPVQRLTRSTSSHVERPASSSSSSNAEVGRPNPLSKPSRTQYLRNATLAKEGESSTSALRPLPARRTVTDPLDMESRRPPLLLSQSERATVSTAFSSLRTITPTASSENLQRAHASSSVPSSEPSSLSRPLVKERVNIFEKLAEESTPQRPSPARADLVLASMVPLPDDSPKLQKPPLPTTRGPADSPSLSVLIGRRLPSDGDNVALLDLSIDAPATDTPLPRSKQPSKQPNFSPVAELISRFSSPTDSTPRRSDRLDSATPTGRRISPIPRRSPLVPTETDSPSSPSLKRKGSDMDEYASVPKAAPRFSQPLIAFGDSPVQSKQPFVFGAGGGASFMDDLMDLSLDPGVPQEPLQPLSGTTSLSELASVVEPVQDEHAEATPEVTGDLVEEIGVAEEAQLSGATEEGADDSVVSEVDETVVNDDTTIIGDVAVEVDVADLLGSESEEEEAPVLSVPVAAVPVAKEPVEESSVEEAAPGSATRVEDDFSAEVETVDTAIPATAPATPEVYESLLAEPEADADGKDILESSELALKIQDTERAPTPEPQAVDVADLTLAPSSPAAEVETLRSASPKASDSVSASSITSPAEVKVADVSIAKAPAPPSASALPKAEETVSDDPFVDCLASATAAATAASDSPSSPANLEHPVQPPAPERSQSIPVADPSPDVPLINLTPASTPQKPRRSPLKRSVTSPARMSMPTVDTATASGSLLFAGLLTDEAESSNEVNADNETFASLGNDINDALSHVKDDDAARQAEAEPKPVAKPLFTFSRKVDAGKATTSTASSRTAARLGPPTRRPPMPVSEKKSFKPISRLADKKAPPAQPRITSRSGRPPTRPTSPDKHTAPVSESTTSQPPAKKTTRVVSRTEAKPKEQARPLSAAGSTDGSRPSSAADRAPRLKTKASSSNLFKPTAATAARAAAALAARETRAEREKEKDVPKRPVSSQAEHPVEVAAPPRPAVSRPRGAAFGSTAASRARAEAAAAALPPSKRQRTKLHAPAESFKPGRGRANQSKAAVLGASSARVRPRPVPRGKLHETFPLPGPGLKQEASIVQRTDLQPDQKQVPATVTEAAVATPAATQAPLPSDELSAPSQSIGLSPASSSRTIRSTSSTSARNIDVAPAKPLEPVLTPAHSANVSVETATPQKGESPAVAHSRRISGIPASISRAMRKVEENPKITEDEVATPVKGAAALLARFEVERRVLTPRDANRDE